MFETADIPITPEVLTLIAEIDEFKGAWRALGSLAPERLSALRRVATIESIGSSTRIEGSKLPLSASHLIGSTGNARFCGTPGNLAKLTLAPEVIVSP